MNKEAMKTPVPNHVHGRITDISFRLRDVRNQFSRVLDRLRPLPENNLEGTDKARVISHSVQDKLVDVSDTVRDLENLAAEFEEYIGLADEDVPKQSRAIG